MMEARGAECSALEDPPYSGIPPYTAGSPPTPLDPPPTPRDPPPPPKPRDPPPLLCFYFFIFYAVTLGRRSGQESED